MEMRAEKLVSRHVWHVGFLVFLSADAKSRSWNYGVVSAPKRKWFSFHFPARVICNEIETTFVTIQNAFFRQIV